MSQIEPYGSHIIHVVMWYHPLAFVKLDCSSMQLVYWNLCYLHTQTRHCEHYFNQTLSKM